MILNVPILGQRDSRWASQRLGTVDGTSIGGFGCIITCMAMLATYYNHPITPDIEDNWLTDNQGYVQGNLYRNDAFAREFPDCKFDSTVSCTNIPAPLGQIDSYLNAGKPVVVMVDFDHDPSDGIQTHFVLLVGKQNNSYVCNDPWYGDQTNFDARYGEASKSINQINFFSGPVPNNITQEKPIILIQEINDQTKYDFGEGIGIQELGAIRSQIKDYKSANTQQISTLFDLNQELEKVNQDKDNLSKQLIDCQNKPEPSPTTIYSNPKTFWGKIFESLAVKAG